MALTLGEVKNYIKIDNDITEDDDYLNELIEVSQIYIDDCAGEDYKIDEKLTKLAGLLQKKLINDMYENRSGYVVTDKRDVIVSTILDKLSMAEIIDTTTIVIE
jgi:uncharacterized phage protein (predicted DNA packaging)